MEQIVQRRRDSVQTKARILAAANRIFAEHGYARAGLRDIAAEAEVASSLIVRYFGTKAGLFEAALIETIRTNSVFAQEKHGFGQLMAQLVEEQSNIAITAMLVMALADPEAKAAAQRVSEAQIIGPLADWLGPPDAYARALNMFALLTGFAVQMQALRSEAIPPASLKWLAGALDAIVDQSF
jgi:AcrR family transcriptional regulator